MTAGKRRTKGAGGVFQDARGAWHFRREITPDPGTGKRRYIEATSKIKSDARARFDEKIKEYERTGQIRTSTGPYIRDYAQTWLEEHRKSVKPNTWTNESSWMRTMCEHIGGIRLAQLTAADLQRMRDILARTRSTSTIKCYFGVLNSMLKDAEINGIIENNPMRRLRPLRKRSVRQREILGPREPGRLLSAAIKTGLPSDTPAMRDMWRLMFELAFVTGMRPGERYALMPFQLERRNGVPGIRVCQQIQRYAGCENAVIPEWLHATHLSGQLWLTTPKSERGNRFLPVSESLWIRMWEHVARWGIGPRQLMFANSYGRPIGRYVELRRWQCCLEAAGLPQVDIYSARHWMSTVLGEAGASDDERMQIMGHADMATTARYTHWSEKTLARAMSSIPDLVS